MCTVAAGSGLLSPDARGLGRLWLSSPGRAMRVPCPGTTCEAPAHQHGQYLRGTWACCSHRTWPGFDSLGSTACPLHLGIASPTLHSGADPVLAPMGALVCRRSLLAHPGSPEGYTCTQGSRAPGEELGKRLVPALPVPAAEPAETEIAEGKAATGKQEQAGRWQSPGSRGHVGGSWLLGSGEALTPCRDGHPEPWLWAQGHHAGDPATATPGPTLSFLVSPGPKSPGPALSVVPQAWPSAPVPKFPELPPNGVGQPRQAPGFAPQGMQDTGREWTACKNLFPCREQTS